METNDNLCTDYTVVTVHVSAYQQNKMVESYILCLTFDDENSPPGELLLKVRDPGGLLGADKGGVVQRVGVELQR
jgi:hypothetical protein